MAAIDFPASPTVGQGFVANNGVAYTWNGTLWLATSSAASQGGDFRAYNSSDVALGAAAVLVFNTVNLGNSGGWYSTSTGRFTPPAGRYHLFAQIIGYSASGATDLGIILRKNGTPITGATAVQRTTGVNTYSSPVVEVTADANGTDYFDVTGQASPAGAGQGSFLAYPVSGIKGPPGDQPTGGGIIREVTLASPAATIDLFSLGVKSVQVLFRLQPVNDAVHLLMREATGSVVNTAADHNFLYLSNSSSTPATPSGANNPGLVHFQLAYSAANVLPAIGHIIIPDFTLNRGMTAFSYYLSPSSILYNINGTFSGAGGAGVNGLQFFFSAGNIAAGSFVRVIGWP